MENNKGLSTTDILNLQNQLQNITKEMSTRGQEMILELVQHTEKFLYEHNRPATKSFYDEMLMRQKELEMYQKQTEKSKLEKEVFFYFFY